MILHITAAEYLHDYKLAVTFDHACSGVADLADAGDSCRPFIWQGPKVIKAA